MRLLERSDIIAFSGGLVSRLMKSVDNLGLRNDLLELFQTKVVLGFSAGAMSMSKTQHFAKKYIGEPDPDVENDSGFGVIDFEIYPHFEKGQEGKVRKLIPEGIKSYAFDNDAAIAYRDGDLDFVGDVERLS
jgi:peptidase E